MVISFSSHQAKAQLLEKGSVVTFRRKQRTMLGDDWANEGRGKPKFADVYITEVGLKKTIHLKPYLSESGFFTIEDWFDELVILNDWDGFWELANHGGWLYRVTLRARMFVACAPEC